MNIIGIYPGTFQPPTLGNYRAYELLKKHTGVNTFVTTNDVINLPNSPLTFQDKQQIWTRHGVPIDKVVMSKDPTMAAEVLQKFGPDRTVVIFAMTKKDAQTALQDPSGKFVIFNGLLSNMESMNKQAYVFIIPDEVLYINKEITPDIIRKAFGSKSLSEEKKKSFFKQLFGWYDISLFDLIKKKFAEAGTVKERMNESIGLPIVRRTLKTFVKEILDELITPQAVQQNIATDVDQQAAALSPSDAAKQARLKKDLARKKLKDLQTQLDLRKKKQDNDKKQGNLDVRNLDNQVKSLKKEI